MGGGREIPILISTAAIVWTGTTLTNAKRIVPKSNFVNSVFYPPCSGQKSQPLHPFSVLMESTSKLIVCDSSMRLSERIFMRIIPRIIGIVIANGLPTSEKKVRFGIIV